MVQANKPSENPYLFAFLDWFLNEKGRSEKSVKAYRWEINRFLFSLKQTGTQIQDCKKANIRAHIASLQNSQPSARSRTLYCIRSFFKFLVREGYITTDPSATIDSPKISRKVPQFLLNDEFKNLVKITKTKVQDLSKNNVLFSELIKKKSFDSKAAILALLSAGVEKKELIALKKEDFNSKTKQISINCGMHQRKIKLDELQNRIITKHIAQRSDSENILVADSQGKIPSIKDISIKESSVADNRKTENKTNLKSRDLAIIVLLLGTGIRRSELVGLDKKDYDKTGKTIRITRKGGDEQIVELNDEVCSAIDMYLEKRTDKLPPIFLSAKKQRLSAEGLFYIVKNLLKSAGLKGSTHTLRHTFVTALIRQGVPLAVVQQLVGHKNAQTTVRYTHIVSQDRREAVKNLKLGLK